jgi:hypothetical protein
MSPDGTGDVDIKLAPGAEENDLAVMWAEIVKGNLKSNPGRVKDFNKLNGNVWVTTTDAGKEITLEHRKSSLIIHDGHYGKPMIQLITDGTSLLELTHFNIKMGLPYYFDENGMNVIKKLIKRQVVIKGLLTHTIQLTYFTKIMSVM